MWCDYFDKIYLLNLPERRDRYWISTWELARYSIPYTVQKAIRHPDGREGLYLTTKDLFTRALAAGYQRILVFEDDLKFVCDPGPVMEKCIAQLPPDFDLFYMGCNLAERPARFYSDNLLPVSRALSTHAVAYSRACMERILSMPKSLPIDLMYAQAIQNRGRSFCACPFLVTQYPGFSDIEKAATDWTPVLDKRFQANVTPLLKIMEHENRHCCRA